MYLVILSKSSHQVPASMASTSHRGQSRDFAPLPQVGRKPLRERSVHKVREHLEAIFSSRQPHLESPQERQVIHPSIMINATVLHLLHS
jgi:hypothetical protein